MVNSVSGTVYSSSFSESVLGRLAERLEATGGDAYVADEGGSLTRQFARLPPLDALNIHNTANRVTLSVVDKQQSSVVPEVFLLLEQRNHELAERALGYSRDSVRWELADAADQPDVRVFARRNGKHRAVELGVSAYSAHRHNVNYRAEVFRAGLSAARMLGRATIEVVDGRLCVKCSGPVSVAAWSVDKLGPGQLSITPFESSQAQLDFAVSIVESFGRPVLLTVGDFDLEARAYQAWRDRLTRMNLLWQLNAAAQLHPSAGVVWSGVLPPEFDWIPLGQWREAGITVRVDAMRLEGKPVLVFSGVKWEAHGYQDCSDSTLRQVIADIVDDPPSGAVVVPRGVGVLARSSGTGEELIVSATRVFQSADTDGEFATAIARLEHRLRDTGGIRYSSMQPAWVCGTYASLPSLASLDVNEGDPLANEGGLVDADGLQQREMLDVLASRIALDSTDPRTPSSPTAPPGLTIAWSLPDVQVRAQAVGRSMVVKVSWNGRPFVDPPVEAVNRRAALFRIAVRASGLPTDAEFEVVDGQMVAKGDRYFATVDETEERGPNQIILRPIRSFREQLDVMNRIVSALGPVVEARADFSFDEEDYDDWREQVAAKGRVYRLVVPGRPKPEADEIWKGQWPGELEWIPLGRWSEPNGITIEADAFMTESGPSLVFRGYQRDGESVTRFCSEERLRELLGDLLT